MTAFRLHSTSAVSSHTFLSQSLTKTQVKHPAGWIIFFFWGSGGEACSQSASAVLSKVAACPCKVIGLRPVLLKCYVVSVNSRPWQKGTNHDVCLPVPSPRAGEAYADRVISWHQQCANSKTAQPLELSAHGAAFVRRYTKTQHNGLLFWHTR